LTPAIFHDSSTETFLVMFVEWIKWQKWVIKQM
jgi:hypothetical protein